VRINDKGPFAYAPLKTALFTDNVIEGKLVSNPVAEQFADLQVDICLCALPTRTTGSKSFLNENI
jgi:hypothetical protein